MREGRKEGRMDGWMDAWKDGWRISTDPSFGSLLWTLFRSNSHQHIMMDGWMDGWTH